jgi:hypothetical protein
VTTAKAQGEQNIAAAIAQANLNRINQVTPQGSLTYTQDGVNSDGTPRYTQTMTLSPEEQRKYELNNQVANALNGLAVNNVSRVADAQSTPFSYDGMTPIRTSIGGGSLADIGDAGKIKERLDYSGLTKLPGTEDFGAEQRRMADTVYAQAASRLDPRFSQREGDLKARLAAQGISENSDAYRRAVDNEARDRNDAYNQAVYTAQQAGSSEQSRIFGLAMSARQQGQDEENTSGAFQNTAQQQRFGQEAARTAVANQNAVTRFNQSAAEAAFNNQARQQQIQEAAYLRNLPLNDIAALLGTGPGVADPNFNPVSQVGVAAPDYMGAVNNQYNAQMQQYNAQQQARSQMLGSIFGAVGTIGGAAVGSDIRFKENIKRIGTLANGIATYAFTYIGDKVQRFGVMAQEVLPVIPDAVVYDRDGFMYVDYSKVY